jgi:hypothetical protein
MVFRATRAEFYEDVNKHGHNNQKNAEANEEHELGRLEEQFGRAGKRLEDVRDAMNLRSRRSLRFGG